MEKRKSISSSLRWSVFARDGFTCRYCGARAGTNGVELHCDHIKSVADGGDNSYDNLLTACNKCNGGKSARSLDSIPASSDAIDRLLVNAQSVKDQADAINSVLNAEKQLRDAAIRVKRDAYGDQDVYFGKNEVATITKWIRNHGARNVAEWYGIAAGNGVGEREAVRYVAGIIKNKLNDEKSIREDEWTIEADRMLPNSSREISYFVDDADESHHDTCAGDVGVVCLEAIYQWLVNKHGRASLDACQMIFDGFLFCAQSNQTKPEASANA